MNKFVAIWRMMHARGPVRPLVRKPEPKKPTRCGLPKCKNLTTHNGGYCCADHCHKHRQLQRDAGRGA